MIDASLPAVRILQGDCLQSLADLDDGAADLVYMDPPFNTGHAKRAQGGAFADDWKDIDAYLSYMRPRIEQCRRVLHENGSILLHCDWRTVHHFRLMLDEFFGPRSHVNHLIWRYGLGGSSPRRFARKHDDILFHARSDAYYFQAPRVPATSQRMKGQTKKATDVLDVPAINNMASERVDYPTQKPLALLRMLIEACCPPGGLVVDPFCGSGTTLVAAQMLDRRACGIDLSDEAVELARRRAAERVEPATSGRIG